ncbi:hypothetical protein ACKKBG_A30765 [Auxenochlorella protothecoides x Auxenochlorella symbiontica]
MSRACLGLRRAWWVGWWAILAIVSLHTARDALAPSACETTYLWQAYEEILLPSNVGQQRGYRLIRYVDNPTEEAQGRLGYNGSILHTVIFVHGHLGTPEQMRSLASQTGRELVKRWRAGGRELPVRWLAPDFGREASALDHSLLVPQSQYLYDCLQYLQPRNPSPSGGVVLVGYSMGVLTAQALLSRMASDQDPLLPSIRAFLRLAEPGTRAFPALLPSPGTGRLLRGGGPGLGHVPSLGVVPGKGDGLIPDTLGLNPGSQGAGPPRVLMQDVPGVWTGGSHKSILSCNQLVCRLAGGIVDALHCADSACVRAVLQRRLMPTMTATFLGLTAATEQAVAPHDCTHLGRQRPSGAWEAAGHVASSRKTWPAPGQQRVRHLLLLPALGGQGTWAVTVGGRPVDLEKGAFPLPPWRGQTDRSSARPWQEIMAGVDWLANATHLLSLDVNSGEEVTLHAHGNRSRSTFVPWQLACQLCLRPPSAAAAGCEASRLVLPELVLRPGSTLALPPGHPFMHALVMPSHGLVARLPSAFGPGILPWRVLGRQVPDGDSPWGTQEGEEQAACGGPLLLGQAPESGGWTNSAAIRHDGQPRVQLWREGLPGRHVARQWVVLSDPLCRLELRLEWDVLAWLAARLHARAAALPALLMACTVPGAGTEMGPHPLNLAALLAISSQSGSWLEAVGLLFLAQGMASILVQACKHRGMLVGAASEAMGLALVQAKRGGGEVENADAARAPGPARHPAAAPPLVWALIAGSCLVHRSLPPVLGLGWAACGTSEPQRLAHLAASALAPAAQLAGWGLGGNWAATPLDASSAALTLLGLRACAAGRLPLQQTALLGHLQALAMATAALSGQHASCVYWAAGAAALEGGVAWRRRKRRCNKQI